MTSALSLPRPAQRERSPWPALWAMVVGIFMILVDTTIVSVANPAIKAALDPASADLDDVVWVTSAYLLSYATLLLLAGRLGDRFGPKTIYLIGLSVFTLASLGCGFSDSLGTLIAMRAVQGVGAALMTPQTMAVITRTFPAAKRGAAMGLWGATSGLAMLVGPLVGGLLVDALGWEWIFFVNVPVGVVGFILVWLVVPRLETHTHRFDVLGVVLSGLGLSLIVFGLQEGGHYEWGTVAGPITIWMIVASGVLVLGCFVWQQFRTRREPLVPMGLFRDRNFAVANIAIAALVFSVASVALPLQFYLQLARGLTPAESGLLLVPMALAAGFLSPVAGRILDRTDARFLLIPGMLASAGALLWYASLMDVDTPTWWMLFPAGLMGMGQAAMWGPLATTATRNLRPRYAGAGAGVYSTTRTIGSVIGTAAIAALMQARLQANLPGATGAEFAGGVLAPSVAGPFAQAMAQAVILPAAATLIGLVAVLFLRRPAAGSR